MTSAAVPCKRQNYLARRAGAMSLESRLSSGATERAALDGGEQIGLAGADGDHRTDQNTDFRERRRSHGDWDQRRLRGSDGVSIVHPPGRAPLPPACRLKRGTRTLLAK